MANPDDRPSPDESPKRTVDSGPPAWIGMTSLGFEFLAAMLLPGAAGWWLDGQFGSAPWLMLAGGLIGFAVGLRLLIRSADKTFKNTGQ